MRSTRKAGRGGHGRTEDTAARSRRRRRRRRRLREDGGYGGGSDGGEIKEEAWGQAAHWSRGKKGASSSFGGARVVGVSSTT